MTTHRILLRAAIIAAALLVATLVALGGYRIGLQSAATAQTSDCLSIRAADETLHAAVLVQALRLFRANQPNEALQHLETSLDMTTLAMMSFCDISDEPLMRQSGRLKTWADIKHYREQYPSPADSLATPLLTQFWRSFPEPGRAP